MQLTVVTASFITRKNIKLLKSTKEGAEMCERRLVGSDVVR
jgi:hypothetical protein